MEEHALLMASMFRAVKYETTEEVEKSHVDKKKESMQSSKNKKNKGNKDEDENEEEDEKHKDTIISTAQNSNKPSKKKKGGPMMDDSLDLSDRVFVCLGTLKDLKKPHAWVMTLNKTYDEVTFWEVNQPRKFTLVGRIDEGEDKSLQAYLSPNLTDVEKKQIEEQRKIKRQESSIMQSELDNQEDDEQGETQRNEEAENHLMHHKDITDDEKEDDSDFLDNMQKYGDLNVYYDDLDQKYKGMNINDVGKIQGLSKEKQQYLKQLDYMSDEDDDCHEKKPQKNKFLAE